MDSGSQAEDELGLSFDVQVLPELAFEDALLQDVMKVVFQRRGVIRDLVPQLHSYGRLHAHSDFDACRVLPLLTGLQGRNDVDE